MGSGMRRIEEFEVIIIGGGPAGLCAAMYAGRGMLKAVLLERGMPGGELLNTEWIDDYPGFEHILGRGSAVVVGCSGASWTVMERSSGAGRHSAAA